MTAARLEELARKLNSESKFYTYRGPCSAADLQVASKCVMAIASIYSKVTFQLAEPTDHEYDTQAFFEIATLCEAAMSPTAIEAVEAAEVKP